MKNKNNVIVVTVLFITMFCTYLNVFASVNKNTFQYYKMIDVQKTGYVKVPIDGEIYNKTNRALSDIRIYNDSDGEIPYVIYREKKKYDDARIQSDHLIINKSYRDDMFFFTIDRKNNKEIVNKMIIDINNNDYLYRVELQGSNDSEEWLNISIDGYLHDLNTKNNDIGKEIRIDDNNFRYLKVKLISVMGKLTDKEFVSAQLAYLEENTVDAVRIPSEIIEHKEQKERSSFIIDTKYNNTLFDKLKFVTSDINFNRNIEVFGSNHQKEWQRVENSQISVYQVGDIDVSNDELEVRPSRFRYIKVNVVNNDNVPIDIQEIEVYQTPEYLIFDSQLEHEYRIYFGNDTIQKPEYDFGKVIDLVDMQTIGEANVSGIMENQQYSDDYKPLSERYEYLIWIIIVVMVGALGYLIIKNLKKISDA